MKMYLKLLTWLFYLASIILWFSIISFALIVNQNGVFSVFSDFFGQWSIWAGLGIAAIVLVAPVYLRCLIKKDVINRELKISIFSIIIIVLFIVVSIGAFFLTAMQFQDFTTQKWLKYPRERYIMVENLIQEHNLIGMKYEQTIQLLGMPDRITESSSIAYSYEHGEIEISFNNENRASEIYVH